MSFRIWIATFLVASMPGVLCKAQPTTRPAEPQFVVTPMRVQQLNGAEHFLYAQAETTFADLKQTIDKLMPLVDPAVPSMAQPGGAHVFVYQGISMEPNSRFTLRIGIPVKPGTTPPQGTKLGKLEAIRAATVVYSGSLQHIGQAFGQLYSDLPAAGLQPTGESCETYIYWEGPESKNNVIILQAGVK